jgi:DNA-binding SARP family transcriptional activator
MHRSTPPEEAAPRVQLHLLNSFEVVRNGVPVPLAPGAQCLVAFLALQERPVRREFAAGMLWPEVPDDRAAANLRSALWRVQKQLRGLISTTSERLHIDLSTGIDLRDAEYAAHAVLDDGECDLRLLSYDLLPDWYDDWVALERERFRQLRLSALETLCERHTRAGRLGEALEAGLLSVASEPLRESAHRALIRVHLATGNAVEAIRQYGVCRRLLHDQLGVEPTPQLRALIDALGT